MQPIPIIKTTLLPSIYSIKDFLLHVRRTNEVSEYIVLTDLHNQPLGVLRSSDLYANILFNFTHDESLLTLADNHFISVTNDTSYINYSELADIHIVVVDETGACMGIADKTKLLLNHFTRNENSGSSEESQNLLRAIIISDVYGNILKITNTARRLLSSAGIGTVATNITELVPNFNFSNPESHYTREFDSCAISFSTELKPTKNGIYFETELSDRTEYVKLHSQMSKYRDNYRLIKKIVDNSYDELYVTDNNGRCIYVNPACERLYGLKANDMIGKTSSEFLKAGIISSDLCLKVINSGKRMHEIQTTALGRKMMVVATPVFDRKGTLTHVVLNSHETIPDTFFNADNNIEINGPAANKTILKILLDENDITTESSEMKQTLDSLAAVVNTKSNVILYGETGVGKSTLAKLICQASVSETNTIYFDCSQYNVDALPKKLFGYSDKQTGIIYTGAIQEADNKVLIIDKFECLPFDFQGQLLQALKGKPYAPIDSNISVQSNFRLILILANSPADMIDIGRLQDNLFYSGNFRTIEIPPLRLRKHDIALMIHTFINRYNQRHNSQIALSLEAMEYLTTQNWPGNIIELRNTINQLVESTTTNTIEIDQVINILDTNHKTKTATNNYADYIGTKTLPDIIESFEKELFINAMSRCKSSYDVAELLGISQSTATRKIRKYVPMQP